MFTQPESALTYSELTFRDPNPLKRFLQRKRLTAAIDLARPLPAPRAILDFGAGNGELCKLLRSIYPHSRILCYEPAETLMREAKQNIGYSDVEFLSDLDAIKAHSVDLVFCLEVFEHLPPEETALALQDIARALSKGGRLIIGVPIETGFPALYKGIFRMSRRYGAFDATLRNVLACAFGKPPRERPKNDIGAGRYYFPYHVGFDHRRFQSTLSANFSIKSISATPFQILGSCLNPEAYFLATSQL